MVDLHEDNEFVDYYALLEVPVDSGEAELRKRIFELYDEARQNLEHRSHRKRFYYVSLYETHLARARYFLLDAARRPRYDDCLRAFQAGQPFDYRSLFDKTTPAKTAAGAPAVTAPAVTAPAVEPSPAAVAAPSPPSAPAPVESAAPAKPAPTVDPVPVRSTPAPGIPAPSATPPVAAPAAQAYHSVEAPLRVQSAVTTSGPPPAAEKPAGADRLEKLFRTPTLDPEQLGRRRDYQRRELIGQELKAQGRFSSLITIGLLILAGAFMLWKLERSLVNPKDGTLSPTDVVVILTACAVLCGVAYVAGWYASRLTRRQIIAKLSRMSYDELLRHCRS